MIEIKNLTKEFAGFKAVDDISFAVKPGEVLGFLGPNGAGKSTTMKMIAGFIKPTRGQVKVMGKSVRLRPIACRRQIGYLPEGAPLYADMTPPDFLLFVARMRSLPKSGRADAIKRVMQQLELDSVAHKRIDELSKGFKRRVGIAQAIIHDPAVLILDEPTDGLDPNQKHQVRRLIRNLSAEKIVILSTHILEEVSAVCNRAVVIANGKLVADNTPAELQARSRYHQAVTLQFPQGSDMRRVETRLQSLPGIASAEITADQPFRVTAVPDAQMQDRSSIYADVTRLVEQEGWSSASVFVEAGRLDDVFMDITGGLRS